MKLYPECVPCMLKRALMFCEDEGFEERKEIIKKICSLCADFISDDTTTTGLAFERNKIIEEYTNNPDPMRDLKDLSFSAAEKIYPLLEEYLDSAKDEKERFMRALKVAYTGNILEFGARDHQVDLERLEEQVKESLESRLGIDDSELIYEKVRDAKEILYVTDNAAEVVFDRLLIKELLKYAKVYVAPLRRPVQDDATVHEIEKAGLDSICEGVIPRSDFLGMWFERCTPEFLERFEKADLVIAKGMGCYETLMDHPERLTGKIGLLLKAKCLPVATDIGVEVGDPVIKLL